MPLWIFVCLAVIEKLKLKKYSKAPLLVQSAIPFWSKQLVVINLDLAINITHYYDRFAIKTDHVSIPLNIKTGTQFRPPSSSQTAGFPKIASYNKNRFIEVQKDSLINWNLVLLCTLHKSILLMETSKGSSTSWSGRSPWLELELAPRPQIAPIRRVFFLSTLKQEHKHALLYILPHMLCNLTFSLY